LGQIALRRAAMLHDAWNVKLWSQKRHPLLGYGLVNMWQHCWANICCYALASNYHMTTATVMRTTAEELW
jgi:hypothetical protein